MSYYDKRFIEEYLCNRTNMFYRYKNFYDAVGKPTYNEIYTFKMKCELLEIVNDKIRIYYHIPINDKDYSATFVNDFGRNFRRRAAPAILLSHGADRDRHSALKFLSSSRQHRTISSHGGR